MKQHLHYKNLFVAIFAIVICSNFRTCYLELSQEKTFCLKNSVDGTVSTFWREANNHCAKDPYKLMDLYEQIVGGQESADKCSSLLLQQLQKSLIDTCVQIFEEALRSNGFSNNVEMDRLAKHILRDPVISEAVFEKLVDAVYLFMDKSELAMNLYSNKNFQQVVTSLLYLNSKFVTRADIDPKFSSKMAYYLRLIQHRKEFLELPPKLRQRVLKAIHMLPATLRSIFFSKVVHILNLGYWEYLYAPRDIGPNSMQRTALTWTAKKNETDTDCEMTLETDESGSIAFAKNYDGVLKFMYRNANDQRAYFWLSQQGHDDSRWWEVHYYEDYLTFQETTSKGLMCSIVPYDEYRRIVSLGTQSSEFDVPMECRWTANPVVQLE